MPAIRSIEDLRALARARTPRMVFDYIESGSWREITLELNLAEFARIGLRQRVAVDVERRNLASGLLGPEVSMPLALAPVGLAGVVRAELRLPDLSVPCVLFGHSLGAMLAYEWACALQEAGRIRSSRGDQPPTPFAPARRSTRCPTPRSWRKCAAIKGSPTKCLPIGN